MNLAFAGVLVASPAGLVALGTRPFGPTPPDPRKVWGPGREWVTGLGDWGAADDSEYVPPKAVLPVRPEFEAEAVAEVGRRPVVPLADDRFRRLAGRDGPPPAGSRAFLVRGVAYEGAGSCWAELMGVDRRGDTLVGVCQVATRRPLLKRPLIVLLTGTAVAINIYFSIPV